MGSEKFTDSTGRIIQNPDQSCPRNYKPWIWTLVVMALITIVWALYEGSQQEGYINTFLSKGQAVKNQTAPGPNPATGNPYAVQAGLATPGPVGDLQTSFHGIIDMVRPAVVSVDAAMKNPQTPVNQAGVFDPTAPADINFNKIGAGVIIDPRGYMLSSYHVIAGAEALKATVHGPGGATEYPLKLVKADIRSDMALLRIQGAGPFPYAVLGNSDAIRTGDMVLTIGSPFGFDQTVTSGMISSRNRTLQVGDTIYENLIQTDSSINRGSSGGPMVNVQGEVVGISTAIFAPTGVFNGIGFAIPINRAAELVGGVIDFKNTAPGVAAGQLVAMTSQGRQVGNAYRLPGGQMVTPPHGPRGACIDCHPQLFEPQQAAQGGAVAYVPANAHPQFQQNGLHANIDPWQQQNGVLANTDPLWQQQNGLHINTDPLWQQQQQGLHIGAGAGRGRGLFGRTGGGPVTGAGPYNAIGQQVAYVEPMMGVGLVDVDDTICKLNKMLHPEGVVVTSVASGSPADIAGLRQGDVLVRIAGRKIINIASLNKLLSSQNLGKKFDVIYLRNGARDGVKIRINKAQGQPVAMQNQQQVAAQQTAAYQWPLGASITPLTPTAMKFTKTGVSVQNVGGLLAASGLRNGDIIKGINGRPVEDLEVFMKQSRRVDSRKGFVLDVIRSGNSIYLNVKG